MSSIRALPDDVVAQIKSSTTITTLNGVVVELLKNSLDATSSKITIDIDYGRGSCIVEDNGVGIPPADFQLDGGLGKLYHSSKYNIPCASHGTRGSFLASLAALSLLSITSHHHLHYSQNSITMNMSKVIARQIPVPPQKQILGISHGTRVVVRDLFGNMPVRVKQRATISIEQRGGGRDWDDLRKEITSLDLAWPYSLIVTLRNVVSGQKIQLRGSSGPNSPRIRRNDSELSAHVCNVLSQAAFIDPQQKSFWVPIGASTSKLSIKGIISLEPAPTKNIQFISLGIYPVDSRDGHNVLYEDINRVFSSSTFGTTVGAVELDDEERQRRSKDRRYRTDGFTNQELRGPSKSINRWPMFYIKIEVADEYCPHIYSDALLGENMRIPGSISELLQLMVFEFLRDHQFHPKQTHSCGSKNLGKETVSSVPTIEGMNAKIELGRMKGMKDASVSTGQGRSLSILSSHPRPITGLRADSPFNSWSRIKSGRTMLSPNLSRKPDDIEVSALSNSSSAVQSGSQLNIGSHKHSHLKAENFLEGPDSEMRGLMEMSRGSANGSPTASLVAKSGEVIRKPFEDLIPSRSTKPPIVEGSLIPSGTTNPETEAGTVSWMNPISRESYIIDTRTGLASQKAATSAQSEPSSLSSIPCNQKSRLQSGVNLNREPSAWIAEILEGWSNPVFKPTEDSIPQVSTSGDSIESQQILHGHRHNCSQLDIDRAFKDVSAGFTGKLSKDSLRHAKILSQLDKKFILIKVPSLPERSNGNTPGDMLVIVDQHAADERCRIEELMANFWTTSKVNGKLKARTISGVLFTSLSKPMAFDISRREVQLLEKHSKYFADWGIIYTLPPQTLEKQGSLEQKIMVTALPTAIIERCKLEPRLVIELIRSEAWKYDEKRAKLPFSSASQSSYEADKKYEPENHRWLRKLHDFPQGILDMLNSRACRGAIMFNDELSHAQCKELLSRLAGCAFPFQCAHGRPSMVPLVDLGTIRHESAFKATSGQDTFGASFKNWKDQLPKGSKGGH